MVGGTVVPIKGPFVAGSTDGVGLVLGDEIGIEATVWEGVSAASFARSEEEPVPATEPDEPAFAAGALALDAGAEGVIKPAS